MRTRFVLAALLVICCAGVRAEDGARDGNWWNRQTAGFRLFYVLGFIDGMALGHAFSVPDAPASAGAGRVHDPVVAAQRTYKERSERYFSNITAGQIADSLDDFYRDARNRSVLLADAFDIVLRSLKGEDVDKLVQARRSSAAHR